jgi:hypothetical protein
LTSMDPDVAARLLGEELEDALADLSHGQAAPRLLAVRPPPDLGPSTAFEITLLSGSRRYETTLATGLAMAYLADEEAAVDEWKRWVMRLFERLSS